MMRQLRVDIAELFYEMQLKNRDFARLEDRTFGKPKSIPFRLTPKAYEYLINRKSAGRRVCYWPTPKDKNIGR